MSLSIIGCVVNGPGEALMTDVGFTGGGKGAGMVYLAGKPTTRWTTTTWSTTSSSWSRPGPPRSTPRTPKALQAAE
jgi:4-hydroxy-3-methylbut-2-en-1-yl diphosphate synthase IspG/GcpE